MTKKKKENRKNKKKTRDRWARMKETGGGQNTPEFLVAEERQGGTLFPARTSRETDASVEGV